MNLLSLLLAIFLNTFSSFSLTPDVTLFESGPGEIRNAHGTFLTTDHRGRLVMSWVEQMTPEEPGVLKFATSPDRGLTFGPSVAVPASRGASISNGECPPKVAFKRDGTIVALFRIDEPSEHNPYGGDVYVVSSADEGKTWSAKQSIGGEKGRSRAYFDLQTLPTGEVGALWLEGAGHHAPKGSGSAIRFASTTKGGTFGESVVLSESVCQCCRVRLYVDGKKQIHAVFRSMLENGTRDITHSLSQDNGRTFSAPTIISQDGWIIDGCPHVGPDMAEVGNTLHFTWFTMGGKGDVYRTSSPDNGRTFATRTSVGNSERASHPSLASLGNGAAVFAWDESVDTPAGPRKRIGLKTLGTKSAGTTTYLAGPDNLIRPLVWGKDGETAFVAYTRKAGTSPTVVYQTVKLR